MPNLKKINVELQLHSKNETVRQYVLNIFPYILFISLFLLSLFSTFSSLSPLSSLSSLCPLPLEVGLGLVITVISANRVPLLSLLCCSSILPIPLFLLPDLGFWVVVHGETDLAILWGCRLRLGL